MRVIGLTGGVGAGKSLILHILKEEYGAETVKADEVARELMEPDKKGYLALVKALGNSFLKPDGTIDRPVLAKLIFQDENARNTVDAIIHPLVWKTIRDKILTSQALLIVVEFAIMGEKDDIYDEMWYVHASKPNRISRLAKTRGYTKGRSESMIKSQASEADYMTRCDRIIENNGSIEDVRNQLAGILKNKGQGER